jgi:hypothetical protein
LTFKWKNTITNGEVEPEFLSIYVAPSSVSGVTSTITKIKLEKGRTYNRTFNSQIYQFRNSAVYNSDGTFSKYSISNPLTLTGNEEYIVDVYSYIGNNISINVNDVTDLNLQIEDKFPISNIFLDEPLRKVGEKADYIDFKNGKVVRYIEEDNEGNLTVLSVPKEEKIELPEILLRKGINNLRAVNQQNVVLN